MARKRTKILGLTVAGLVGVLSLAYFDWVRIGIYWVQTRCCNSTHAHLNLGTYRVTLEAHPIAGLRRNASGLSYNPVSDTLLAVINHAPAVAELSVDGELLRHITLPGVKDTEGISHVADDVFLVSDEADNSLHWFRLTDATNIAEPLGTVTPDLAFDHWHNLGLEGVSWDSARRELLLANEKLPQQVWLLQGVSPNDTPSADDTYSVQAWEPRAWLGPLGADLAALTAVPSTGNLLLLSEASGLITEYSRSGRVLGLLPLWRGLHGLRQSVPQAEGIALGADASIYILSEPNLLYRFSRSGD